MREKGERSLKIEVPHYNIFPSLMLTVDADHKHPRCNFHLKARLCVCVCVFPCKVLQHNSYERALIIISPLSRPSLSAPLPRSLTHTLGGSMEGSDTKLMPCHTGCQQISQWITPQPLDVHRAEGHKHERRRGRPSVRLAVMGHVPA